MSRIRWKHAWLLAACVALIVGGRYLYVKKTSPGGMLPRAKLAIESRDVETLIALADPDEVSRLNLTQDSVRGILDYARQARDSCSSFRVEPLTTPADQAVWMLRCPGDTEEIDRGVVAFINDGKSGWKLSLAHTLYALCPGDNRNNWEHLRLFMRAARQFGIKGWRDQAGEYIYFDQMREEKRRNLQDPALASSESTR